MKLKKIDKKSMEFAFECLKEQRGDVEYSYEMFSEYTIKFILIDDLKHSILIAYKDDIPIGLISYNRFLIPRYLGFGYEIKELVIDNNHHGKGYATKLIELFFQFLKELEKDNYSAMRKIIVKTDNRVVGKKLYGKYFNEIDMSVYSKKINYL